MSDRTAQQLVAESLGKFIVESDWLALSDALRHEAVRSLLNSIGCALGVAQTEPIEMAMRVVTQFAANDHATVIGRRERLDILGAAFINAVGANLLDYDDTHLQTVIHPAAPVMPVVLGLAEQFGLSGAEMLHALLLGIEVECRIGNTVSPGHYDRGWHITSTCGVFGAAAAAAKLLRLDWRQASHALGLAASQSAGIVENLPSAAKNFSVGNSARNGLFAALVAAQGYTAAPTAIEGSLGWARAMGDVPMIQKATTGLGDCWEALKNTYKPYPCGIVMHAVIDACLLLRRDYSIDPTMIAAVTISGDQLLLDRGDRTVVSDRDARVSIHHCAAAAFLFGAAGLREFSDEVVHDPIVTAFRRRVSVQLNNASPRGAARATVHLRDDRTFSATVTSPKGSLEHPLTDREIERKVKNLAEQGGFAGDVDAMILETWRLASAPSIRPLAALLRSETD